MCATCSPDEAPARGLTESAMNAPRAVFGDNKPSMSYTDLAARRALSKRLANCKYFLIPFPFERSPPMCGTLECVEVVCALFVAGCVVCEIWRTSSCVRL